MSNTKAERFNILTDEEKNMMRDVTIGCDSCYLERRLNNVSITENGAEGYKTTYYPLVDLNFSVSSLRDMDEKSIVEKFINAFKVDKENTIKWLFFLRDIKEGLGERRSFKIILKHLANIRPNICKKLLSYIPKYGRFDDIMVLLDTSISDDVVEYIKKTLEEDLKNANNNASISLLSKWLPSINTSSKDTKAYAKKLIKKLKISEKEYRQMLSRLRAYSNVLEVKLASNNWDKVDYEKVPSKANMKYDVAFIRHDVDRRTKYLLDVVNGDSKINFKTLKPYEITKKFLKEKRGYFYYDIKDSVIGELMWEKLVSEGFDNKWGFDDCIVVADGSGSMNSIIRGTANLRAIDVCNALAIYFASKLKGAYKNKAITFSMKPQFINMSNCKNLKEKLEEMYSHCECADTNIEVVFDILLELAKEKNIPKEEVPKQVLIISDMEFNDCTGYKVGNVQEKLFDVISKKWEEAGYKLPKLIFWNICGRTKTIPMIDNENGLSLISGFSQKAIKVAASIKNDPYDALKETLNNPRYNLIWDAVKEVA